uniref:Uncharacterized protein LOC104210211 n=1 Tax=Nicotiana sylvestris TaxID=4096 RepID=A0A1U7V6J5_NICSY|nr:PREDICTED: uncharacterized protein LOC104210211 [Nicotiana sylvestris]
MASQTSSSTQTQTSSPNQTTSTQSSLGLPNPPPTISNIKGFVPIELTYLNYLTWKKVFLIVLKSHNLLSLVDGSIPCPTSTHDEYRLWIQCDTITLSWINVTFSPPVLDSLPNYACETSKEAWDVLASLYLDQVSSSSIHLKSKFQNFKKGSLSMEDYLQQLHSLACSLRAVGKPVSDDDLVTQALQGLPSSYRTFVSGLNATGTLPTFLALRPLLLTEEAHINAANNDDPTSHTALVASTPTQPVSQPHSSTLSHTNTYSKVSYNGRGHGRSNKGRGRDQYSTRSNFSNQWAGFQQNFRPSSRGDGVLGRPPFTSTKQCQICFHFNHTALECRNRFNHSYVPNSLPKSFAAMNLEEVQPSIWYPDSGASAHMTNNQSLLSSPSTYIGSSQVMVGNGQENQASVTPL